MNQNWGISTATNYVVNNYPEREGTLMIHFTNTTIEPLAAGHSAWSGFNNDNALIGVLTKHSDHGQYYAIAQHLYHELGHSFNLNHNYDNTNEYCDINHIDFFNDVFDVNGPTGCQTGCDLCPHPTGCHDESFDDPFDYCSNNIMGGNMEVQYWISPLQAGRMHRCSNMYSIRQYIWGYDPVPHEIVSDEVWDFSWKSFKDIVIKPGASLTVQCEVQMIPESKIVVELGGKLIIDGGIITSAKYSDDLWKGVQVHGDASLHQNPTNQGLVIMVSGATIEHAEVGVTLWNPGDWATTGGYIVASGSTFRNNLKDVEFLSYSNSLGGTVNPNKSNFNGVTFTWDDEFKRDQPLAHVTMYDVEGVDFQGCHFNDERSLTQPDPNARGILAIDADFVVDGGCTIQSGCSGDIEDPLSGWNPTVFENLHLGISAETGAGNQTINVDRCVFIDNHIGLNMVSLSAGAATRNRFKYTDDATHIYTNSYMYGLHLMNSDHYVVQENDFVRAFSSNAQIFGIAATDNGEQQEEIYKNNFTSLTIGNFSQGVNRSSGAGDEGLEYWCNTNLDNTYDHLVSGVFGGQISSAFGVDGEVGSPTESAGIVFSAGSAPALTAFNNVPSNNVTYWCSPGGASTAHNITMYDISPVNQCFSQLPPGGGKWGVMTPGDRIIAISEFNQLNEQIELKQEEYNDNLIDDVEYADIMLEIDNLRPNNKQEVRQLLNDYSPYLTTDILFAVADNTPSDYNHPWLRDLMINNIEAVTPALLDFLGTKDFPLPSSMRQDIAEAMESGYTEKSVLEAEISLLISQKSVLGNKLIHHYMQDTSDIDEDSLIWWYKKENDLLHAQNVIDTYLEIGDFVAADLEIKDLEESAPAFSLRVQKEIRDYVALKRWLIPALRKPGGLGSINDPSFLQSMAENGQGKARYQAQNILCFFFEDCPEYTFEAPIGGRSTVNFNSHSEDKLEVNQVIGVYPNPANNWVMIELDPSYLESYENLVVTMTDISGKIINQTQLTRNSYLWETADVAEGMYLITISSDDVLIWREKVVIQK